MSDQVVQSQAPNKKIVVLIACVAINLTIGVLYAWSVMTSKLTLPVAEGGFGWTGSQAGLPFSIAIIVLALAVIIGGRVQDKIGPRWVATASGLLTGSGMILAGLSGNSVVGITVGFGVMAAFGMGVGYASVTPPALKWFHPSKKGLISGLVVGGFGLSAVYFAPLANALLNRFGIEQTMIILGVAIMVICVVVAQLIKNPPPGYTPAAPANLNQSATQAKAAPAKDFKWTEMIRSKRFCLMFLIFLLTSSGGVMIIGNVSRIAQTQANISDTAILAGLVSFLAFMNAAGRVGGGKLSDRIGRINTLFVILFLQMANMAAFAFYQSLPMLLVGIFVAGFCFGALLSVMPALCADQFGLKNFGLNYGILFMAWGFSGVLVPIIANLIFDSTGSFNAAYTMCALMMAAMILTNYLLKKEVTKA